MNLKYKLKQRMTELPFEVIVEKGKGAFHVIISEVTQFAYDDPFVNPVGGAALKRDAIKMQNEIFDYMTEQGFTKVKKVYWDGK